MHILVTGATGFVGSALIDRLVKEPSHSVVAVTRQQNVSFPSDVQAAVIEGLDSNTKWDAALAGVNVVIHTAARAHIMKDNAADPLALFRKVNVDGTLNLAQEAAQCGVKRFIYISSIKVNGESTQSGQLFTAEDTPMPVDPYGISKMEAEQSLNKLSAETKMEVVIIRPPIVYGPSVKANFLSMMRWLNKGIPLPLGAVVNKRSIVALDNLVDLIITCVDHPAASNQIFLAGDGEDLSTPELLRRMSKALGKPARLLPVPAPTLEFAAALLGKRAVAQRLCGSLQVDISKTRNLLDWTPPASVDETLIRTARYFLKYQVQ